MPVRVVLVLKMRVGPHVCGGGRINGQNFVAVQAGKLAQRVKCHPIRGANDAIGFRVKRGIPLVIIELNYVPQPHAVLQVFQLVLFADVARVFECTDAAIGA